MYNWEYILFSRIWVLMWSRILSRCPLLSCTILIFFLTASYLFFLPSTSLLKTRGRVELLPLPRQIELACCIYILCLWGFIFFLSPNICSLPPNVLSWISCVLQLSSPTHINVSPMKSGEKKIDETKTERLNKISLQVINAWSVWCLFWYLPSFIYHIYSFYFEIIHSFYPLLIWLILISFWILNVYFTGFVCLLISRLAVNQIYFHQLCRQDEGVLLDFSNLLPIGISLIFW